MFPRTILIISITIIALGVIWLAGKEVYRVNYLHITKDNGDKTRIELAERMKYHGIDWCYKGDDGIWYFKRGGKECRLF